MVDQRAQAVVAGERRAVTDHGQVSTRTGQRDVQSAQFRQEADLVLVVAAHQRDDYGFFLAALQPVDGADLQLGLRQAVTEPLDLRVVGRDHGDVCERQAGVDEVGDDPGDQLSFSGVVS